MPLHNLLGAERPTSPVAYASNYHVTDDDGGAAVERPVPSDEAAAAAIRGVPVGKPIIALFLIIALLFALRVFKDAAHEAFQHDHTRFREVDITLWNALIVATLAIPGINIWKFFTKEYLAPTNPLRQLVNNV